MRKLAQEQWEAGQVLARPVESDSGQVLATRGTPLSERMIALFKRRGIAELSVEGGSAEGAERLREKLGSLEARFAEHDGRPAMAALKEMFESGYESLHAPKKEEG